MNYELHAQKHLLLLFVFWILLPHFSPNAEQNHVDFSRYNKALCKYGKIGKELGIKLKQKVIDAMAALGCRA